jgi:tetrahydromethanopterin S-methyltransferase subunit A
VSEPGHEPIGARPAIVGDVVFGDPAGPVAVCALASRSLLPALAGRPEIAVAGRVFTENVGVERMIQNLLAFKSIRFLIVCGRETPHRVGQTILALHRSGLDARGRAIGSEAPEPVMPNLTAEQLRHFRERIAVIDMIGVVDVSAILARARDARASAGPPTAPGAATAARPAGVEQVAATRDPASAWSYDPVGYFVVFVDRARRLIHVEQYSREHRLVRAIDGRAAEEISHTIVRLGQVTTLGHAAYLGRELAKAETALVLGLDYEQDRPLACRAFADGRPTAGDDTPRRTISGDDPGDLGAP